MRSNTRRIGQFEGARKGPLVLVITALHGNEPAGVTALQLVLEALMVEAQVKGDEFEFYGKIVGYIGNLAAYQDNQRFIERDLNRVWRPDFVAESLQMPYENRQAEYRETADLYETIHAECASAESADLIFLDLHTTSAEGGIFSIPTDEHRSLLLARALGAPAIMGLQKSIEGTLLKFAAEGGFSTPTPRCVAFEAGQHESPQSVHRAAAAIVRCLRTVGCMGEETLQTWEERSPLPLWPHSPPVLQLRYVHAIGPDDHFKMRPGYANFQPIHAGEHLADDVHGPILSPAQGLILMPLYQPKGSDGFFIVE
ncbi:MAG: succinylglutamate desuccinylase/aspartoacylase family protein [Saprospiraceae bacterium]|nr:succinylglutamate desuccinylase/aspartoacylase family protein [Saprospiraceae bacterium]